MTDIDMLCYLKEQGYENITKIGNRWCAIFRFAFTVGLVVDIDEFGYDRRYCFHTWGEAIESLLVWNGKDHPSGNWIKCKGKGGDISNPNYNL